MDKNNKIGETDINKIKLDILERVDDKIDGYFGRFENLIKYGSIIFSTVIIILTSFVTFYSLNTNKLIKQTINQTILQEVNKQIKKDPATIYKNKIKKIYDDIITNTLINELATSTYKNASLDITIDQLGIAYSTAVDNNSTVNDFVNAILILSKSSVNNNSDDNIKIFENINFKSSSSIFNH